MLVAEIVFLLSIFPFLLVPAVDVSEIHICSFADGAFGDEADVVFNLLIHVSIDSLIKGTSFRVHFDSLHVIIS